MEVYTVTLYIYRVYCGTGKRKTLEFCVLGAM